MSKGSDFEHMRVSELWDLFEEIKTILKRKMEEERHTIEERLMLLTDRNLAPAVSTDQSPPKPKLRTRLKRPYPEVLPLYRNHDVRSETWSGRGNKPRWLVAQIKNGKKLEDFRITPAGGPRKKR